MTLRRARIPGLDNRVSVAPFPRALHRGLQTAPAARLTVLEQERFRCAIHQCVGKERAWLVALNVLPFHLPTPWTNIYFVTTIIVAPLTTEKRYAEQ
ncbi:hypothetical protein GA0070613_4575 [Micromonospora inositola]|uniref:Uncharacterized protein n=1 Tax=Micromonospora inositola TaxID=47865 RepID=A0A1C5JF85_9ACTN|nr:hypothetical protein GA0070613_4575 [Micromonospora inositola]